MPISKEADIISNGPLLWKLARRFEAEVDAQLHDNGADILGVQLRKRGIIFKVDAASFRAALEAIKKEKEGDGH